MELGEIRGKGTNMQQLDFIKTRLEQIEKLEAQSKLLDSEAEIKRLQKQYETIDAYPVVSGIRSAYIFQACNEARSALRYLESSMPNLLEMEAAHDAIINAADGDPDVVAALAECMGPEILIEGEDWYYDERQQLRRAIGAVMTAREKLAKARSVTVPRSDPD
jgi:acetyl-CoA carboxylase alpha subunit